MIYSIGRVLVALLLLAPCTGRAQSPEPDAARSELPRDHLRPGDVIRLRIWREPDLSGDFPVDPSGVVVFPKLGPTEVIRESPESLKSRLVQAYGEFLQHASIEVTLLRRLQVLGAVRSPGLYPVDATMTITDVLALAGGATPEGDPKRIGLVRNGVRLTANLTASTLVSESQIQSGDQLFVPERSWISRNAPTLAAGLSAVATVIIALFAR